jgi:hypothetical protein
MRWRTAHNHARKPVAQCARHGHVAAWGYGLAYGGIGSYHYCRRCGLLFHKHMDDGE